MEWATLPRAAMPTRPSLAKVIDVQLVTERWVAGGRCLATNVPFARQAESLLSTHRGHPEMVVNYTPSIPMARIGG